MSVPAGKTSEEEQENGDLDIGNPYDAPRDLHAKNIERLEDTKTNTEDLDDQYAEQPLTSDTANETRKLGKQKRRTLGSQTHKKKRVEVVTEPKGGDEITSAMIKSRGSKVFSPEMDQAIKQAVEKFGTRWEMIKDYLKYPGVTKEQYQKRYAGYACPEVENREKTPWTVDLDAQLSEMVMMNTVLDRRGKGTINWKTISKAMNRQYFDCQNRWNTLRKGTLLVGRFTPEEDEIIVRTHDEWNGAGKGLWVSLEKTLNRRNDVIRKRYDLLAKKAAKASSAPQPVEVI